METQELVDKYLSAFYILKPTNLGACVFSLSDIDSLRVDSFYDVLEHFYSTVTIVNEIMLVFNLCLVEAKECFIKWRNKL